MRYASPSGLKMTPHSAAQSLAAFSRSVSSTGRRSKAERLITLRTSEVAACCSRASDSACCSSAYGAPGGPLSPVLPRGSPHARQNLACEGLSCWHRGHVMPEPPSGRVGERSEPWAETNRLGLAWSRTLAYSHSTRWSKKQETLK